jgi:prepilin-type processing-associated H-X9-DG protein
MKATGSKKPNFPITKVQRPSQLILIADGSVFTGEGLNGGASDDNSGQYFNRTYPFTADPSNILSAPVRTEADNLNVDGAIGWFRYRHNNTVNCLYLDGHVSNIPYGNRSKEVTFAKFVFSR